MGKPNSKKPPYIPPGTSPHLPEPHSTNATPSITEAETRAAADPQVDSDAIGAAELHRQAVDLRMEYDRLLQLSSNFDGVTKELLKKHEEDRKKLISDRAALRAQVLAEKGEAYAALQAKLAEAEAADKAEAEATAHV